MPQQRILLIQGHPDRDAHFGHALSDAYAGGAREARHEVRLLTLATLDFPILRSKSDWDTGPVPTALAQAQVDIAWAQHIVLFFPLWLGGMPALLKGFLEQVARPGFALSKTVEQGGLPKKLLAGRSARIVVTMGMPGLVYRWYFRAHSVKALERNILGFIGIAPIHETLIGTVEGMSKEQYTGWIRKLAILGAKAA
jgi:putative NADPH-quinone reductase